MKWLVVIFAISFIGLIALLLFQAHETSEVYSYRVIKKYPHDAEAFTQGLVYENGYLYESTGLYGKSTLRKVELETGKVIKLQKLPANYFGEGIAIVGDKIFQLTWRERKALVYDKNTFELLKEFSYATEGWGLTFDGRWLIMSDGSQYLYFIDPETFNVIKKIEVLDKEPVKRLNELEYVEGLIYANVWMDNRIAIIDPENGKVLAWIDLSGIYTEKREPEDVLNGIAYDSEKKRLFVTGKRWLWIFEIEVVSKSKN
ncbi:MAG: glutaminyl-peptide cyclotransferase [Archaeoglobaceae archaeon]|nr:glutaminyl-peptide cyclotransferase [Archaeoglobaceae archaeon]